MRPWAPRHDARVRLADRPVAADSYIWSSASSHQAIRRCRQPLAPLGVWTSAQDTPPRRGSLGVSCSPHETWSLRGASGPSTSPQDAWQRRGAVGPSSSLQECCARRGASGASPSPQLACPRLGPFGTSHSTHDVAALREAGGTSHSAQLPCARRPAAGALPKRSRSDTRDYSTVNTTRNPMFPVAATAPCFPKRPCPSRSVSFCPTCSMGSRFWYWLIYAWDVAVSSPSE